MDNLHNKWVEKVKKELKLDSLESKYVDIGLDTISDPFFQRVPTPIQGHRKEQTWKIHSIIDARKEDAANILVELNGGANSIEILHAESIGNPPEFFKGIILPFINLQLHFGSNHSNIKSLISFLEKEHQKEAIHVELVYAFPYTESHLWEKNIIEITSEQNIEEQLIDRFNQIIKLIDKADNTDHALFLSRKIVFKKIISSRLVEEMSLSKTIDLLWQQVCNGFEIPYYEVKKNAYCLRDESYDLESRYIDLSVKGLAAAISGYNQVCIDSASDDKKEFHKRISRNIHHLLQMESFVQHGYKAYIGSYQVDNIATTLAEKIWKSIGRD